MLSAYGWVVVRSSRDCFKGDVSLNDIDDLDAKVDASDKQLWSRLREWLSADDDPWLKWQFFEKNNNDIGVLQFSVSRNHRGASFWDLMNWIVDNGPGSYGLVYVHDDEDLVGNTSHGRGHADYSNCFRVWRMLDGRLEEFDDPFLSPIVPRVNPSEYA